MSILDLITSFVKLNILCRDSILWIVDKICAGDSSKKVEKHVKTFSEEENIGIIRIYTNDLEYLNHPRNTITRSVIDKYISTYDELCELEKNIGFSLWINTIFDEKTINFHIESETLNSMQVAKKIH